MKYTDMTKEELTTLVSSLEKEYENIKGLDLKLNMARGKPENKQLDLALPLVTCLTEEDLTKNYDYLNYGVLDGIPEAKALFAELLETDTDHVIVYGNSSLNIMYDTVSRAYTHGLLGNTPWCKLDTVKFICPVPGYDRHFAVTERFGIEMIPVALNADGPDMDAVKELVKDEAVKGMWCVPQYGNPSGITFSDAIVKELASLKPAAKDFRLFWDNAYLVHHLYEEKDHVLNILDACKEAGNEDMVFEFASTSKISLPGSGVAVMATSIANKKDTLAQMTIQTIGHDKINQLRHVKYFKNVDGILAHMEKHAAILRPKFEKVEEILSKELGDLDICTWTKPLGGYFVSFNSYEGCAKDIVALCKELGVTLTGAGATYPYKKDPMNSNIRIAPSYPPMDELIDSMKVFTFAVKYVTAKKLLEK